MSEKPRFLYTLRAVRTGMLLDGPTDSEAETITRHFEYLSRLHEAGVVLLAGRTTENDARTIGIVVFEADDERHAARIMGRDPAVSEGVMTPMLQPFRVALGPGPTPSD